MVHKVNHYFKKHSSRVFYFCRRPSNFRGTVDKFISHRYLWVKLESAPSKIFFTIPRSELQLQNVENTRKIKSIMIEDLNCIKKQNSSKLRQKSRFPLSSSGFLKWKPANGSRETSECSYITSVWYKNFVHAKNNS